MGSSKNAKRGSAASNVVTRRVFLVGAGAAAVGASWLWSLGRRPISAEAAAAGAPKMVTIIGFKDDGTRTTKESVARVVKTEAEWKKQLSPAAFEVARRAGT
ncbi:MAG: peptide-methionine (R)-S-oxide reductase, partial [Acidobacteria bacterium]|nr:peptide-methionine (R)-S-oxide reductase [Acidobacteriota bacterium]